MSRHSQDLPTFTIRYCSISAFMIAAWRYRTPPWISFVLLDEVPDEKSSNSTRAVLRPETLWRNETANGITVPNNRAGGRPTSVVNSSRPWRRPENCSKNSLDENTAELLLSEFEGTDLKWSNLFLIPRPIISSIQNTPSSSHCEALGFQEYWR